MFGSMIFNLPAQNFMRAFFLVSFLLSSSLLGEEFDRLMTSIRSRASACGMLPSSDELEPALLAILIELSSRVAELEGERRDDG